MNAFDVAAVLVSIAAFSGYVNARLLKLPQTTGTLAVALVSSLLAVALDVAIPTLGLRATIAAFLGEIDFNQTLMHGMLSFLLFAGALHLDLDGLLANKWTIAALATAGVLISTGIIGLLTYWSFRIIGVQIAPMPCFVFGALISPTDPVAVMGLLRELRAPADLEAQIAGESLFNDGVGVVLFLALASVTGFERMPEASGIDAGLHGILLFFFRSVVGGAALGLALGYAGYRTLKSVDDHPLELLVTLAVVMFTYAVSFRVHVSGPIAVVVVGLLFGNPGRRFAMSAHTREHVDAFWSMMDGILNAVLFLLLGLQVLTVPAGPSAIAAALLAIPIALLARMVSVALPVAAMNARQPFTRGIIPLLTWSGLRGGISVAMALSLPRFPERDLLLACTYVVVVFSILVQGLTVRRVLVRYGIDGVPVRSTRGR